MTDITNLSTLPVTAVEIGVTGADPSRPTTDLVLDDPVFGLLDTATLGEDVSWADVSADAVSFTITRNMNRNGGPVWTFSGGTCSVVLDNSEGAYDPDNTAGPFAGQLVPMVPIRIRVERGNDYKLFTGYADGWTPDDVDSFNSEYQTLTVGASDAFKVFAGVTLAEISVTGVADDTGARVNDILTRAGWYTSGEWRDVDSGNSTLQGTTLGATAQDLMQSAADSELGQLYVRGDGAVIFRNRHAILLDARSNTVQAVFGDSPGTAHDSGTEMQVQIISRATDDTTLVNDVQATIENGGTLQEVKDAASITKYLFPRSYSNSQLQLQGDTDALNWASWVLKVGRDAESRFDSLTINPLSDPDNLWPQVLGREIGDRIQVWSRPTSVPNPIVKDCFIMGITHTVDVTVPSWSTKWILQDAGKYGSFFVLDNPTLGQLNHNSLVF